jgi:drug/metabolite transporter (DMT)-like permease
MDTKGGSLVKWFVPYVLVASFQYQFAKNGLEYASPFVLMGLRYIVVGIFFYVVGGRRLRIDKDTVKIAVFASLSTALWAVGLQYVSPGDSAVLSYTMPLFSIPIAYLALRERATLREIIGALVGFSGVTLYSLTLNHGSLLIGAIFTVLNAVFWAAYSVYYRKLRDSDPVPILTTQFFIGSIPFIIGSFFLPKFVLTGDLFWDLIYIIVFTGIIQYYLWNALLRRGRVGRITTMAFAVPATSIVIDSVLSSSLPGYLSVAGAVVMFLGIFLSSWSEKKRELPSPSDPSSTRLKETRLSGDSEKQRLP